MIVEEEYPLEGLVEERTLRITLFEWWAAITALFVDGTDLCRDDGSSGVKVLNSAYLGEFMHAYVSSAS